MSTGAATAREATMLSLHLWRLVRLAAGAVLRPGPARTRQIAGLAAVDRRTLADIGIGRGEILSVPRSLEGLRRPPHV